MELFKTFNLYPTKLLNIPSGTKCVFKRLDFNNAYEPIIIIQADSVIFSIKLNNHINSINLLRQIFIEYSTDNNLVSLEIKINQSAVYSVNNVVVKVYINTDLIDYYNNKSPSLKYIHQAKLNENIENIYNIIQIKNTTFLPDVQLCLNIPKCKITLFDYQKKNIQRMIDIENKKEIKLKYTQEITYGDKTYIWDPLHAKIISKDRYLKLQSMGGILADEMGLGKTISMLGLIFLNNNTFPSTLNGAYYKDTQNTNFERFYSKATLLVVPPHLAKQWVNEFTKYTCNNKKIVTILTKKSHATYTYQDIKDADLVLVTQHFLMNFKYYIQLHFEPKTPSTYNHETRMSTLFKQLKKWRDEMEYADIMKLNMPILEFFHFNRFVIDEGHEIFERNIGNNRLNDFLLEWINTISCKYRWYISGTPYTSLNGFNECLKFIKFKLISDDTDDLNISRINTDSCDTDDNKKIHNFIVKKYFMEQLLQNLIIRHRKEDVENQINIPGYKEEIEWVTLTDMERKLYDSKKYTTTHITLQQMCCHPLIADSMKKIFSSTNIVDLDTMQEKIIDYHKNRMKTYQAKIDSLDSSTQAYHMLLANYQSIISESKFMLTILEKINDKVDFKEDTNCIICFDDITEPVLTPCGHIYCKECITTCLKYKSECPMCKKKLNGSELYALEKKKDLCQEPDENPLIKKYGAKLGRLIQIIRSLLVNEENKIIVFSQWDNMLSLIGKSLAENGIDNSFIKGNVHARNSAISKFRFGIDTKGNNVKNNVIMLSLKNAASGTTLTEATHIFFVEPINQIKAECIAIEHQAIGRACRIGQTKELTVMRLLCKDTIEEEIYNRLNTS